MKSDEFSNFLQILELYTLKQIPRNSSNHYHDEKDNIFYKRRETTAEHIYSCLKLADYFLTTEEEFAELNKLKCYELLLYHDDVEIITRDTGISEKNKREHKEQEELKAVPILSKKLPSKIGSKLVSMDNEYRLKRSPESKFASAIDKLDALIHELQYPQDWGLKGFDEKNVRTWFEPSFTYFQTFKKYFEAIIVYLQEKKYF